jgi:hypothetical protein
LLNCGQKFAMLRRCGAKQAKEGLQHLNLLEDHRCVMASKAKGVR